MLKLQWQSGWRWLKRLAISWTMVVLLVFLVTGVSAEAAERAGITVYRDPGCRCCGGWMEHLAAEGLQPENITTADLDALKQEYGVPGSFTSCHTAILDDYVIEGHVPIADIKRLLTEHPDIRGITVPGMPIGTPGMESETERESFTVFSFDDRGHTKVFNQYSF